MCTLTYFPTAEGYIFTHNRDESFMREPALPPNAYLYGEKQIVFPKDGRAGGTWIANQGTTSVCLLNGAFTKHKHQPPYRKSRGIVLLDMFTFASVSAFANDYDLDGIEPFTVLIAKGTESLEELRWDGNTSTYKELDMLPAIWSSATLYDTEMQLKRQQLFGHFLEYNKPYSPENILQFHITGNVGDPLNNLVMERSNTVKTLSISQIICTKNNSHFQYLDRIQNTIHVYPNETEK